MSIEIETESERREEETTRERCVHSVIADGGGLSLSLCSNASSCLPFSAAAKASSSPPAASLARRRETSLRIGTERMNEEEKLKTKREAKNQLPRRRSPSIRRRKKNEFRYFFFFRRPFFFWLIYKRRIERQLPRASKFSFFATLLLTYSQTLTRPYLLRRRIKSRGHRF